MDKIDHGIESLIMTIVLVDKNQSSMYMCQLSIVDVLNVDHPCIDHRTCRSVIDVSITDRAIIDLPSDHPSGYP